MDEAAQTQLAVLRALVDLSAVDLLYADQYIHRAAVLLEAVCTREQYLALCSARESVRHLTNELRLAAAREEWTEVRRLAQQATHARERVTCNEQILEIGDVVHGARLVRADATALAFAGTVVGPETDLGPKRAAMLDHLRLLRHADPDLAPFYRARSEYLEAMHLGADPGDGPRSDNADLRRRVLQATQREDFAQVQRLTDAFLNERSLSHPPDPVGVTGHPGQALGTPFPDIALSRAAEMGLAVELLPASGDLRSYMSGHTDVVAPDVRASLRVNLDLLLRQPFVNSAGTRYLPSFGLESMLVETFPENDVDARTPLLEALGLPTRRGLSRSVIEVALRSTTTRVCNALGLDPAEFTVACIPFDVYLRLAPRYGWGQQELWTHFDGYQVGRDIHLRAQVGGDVRYGGPDDLCSVEREYDTLRLTARFVILRRRRFLA